MTLSPAQVNTTLRHNSANWDKKSNMHRDAGASRDSLVMIDKLCDGNYSIDATFILNNLLSIMKQLYHIQI